MWRWKSSESGLVQAMCRVGHKTNVTDTAIVSVSKLIGYWWIEGQDWDRISQVEEDDSKGIRAGLV